MKKKIIILAAFVITFFTACTSTQTFPGGFGGFGDTYALAGDYHDWETDSAGTKEDNFTLVGDYYPVVVTVTHTKGSAVDFNFTGSLTELVKELSESVYTLKAGTEYDEEFEITMLWPLETACTEDCYVVKGNQKPDIMDKADNIFGCTENLDTVGYDLWADFEVTIKEAN